MTGKLAMMLGLAAALAAGCTNQGSAGPSGAAPADPSELQPKANPTIADVPIPVDFRYIGDRSLDSVAPGIRVIYYVFRGNKDNLAVARFFRKQMPLSGWQIRGEQGALGVKTMEFGKESEICRIVIQDGPLFDKTEVRVNIFPVGHPGEAPSPRK
jgi:hypothetical protein